MYQEFLKLTCAPFDLAPDPRFLYITPQHSRAIANVRFALMKHDSFVVITGEIGTGKTTVLNAVLRELGPQYVTARLVHTTLTDIELLQSLLSDFGIPNYGAKKVQLLDELRAFFLEQHLAGRHVVIIVDEAQHLNPAALEELRLLSCIDTHDRRILSIVLTGQPSLDDVVDDPTLAQLRQRTRLRQRLRPLDQPDTAEYIRHRLKIAGGNADDIFAPESFPEIHRLTLGTPRLINTLCDTALPARTAHKRRRAGTWLAGILRPASGRVRPSPAQLLDHVRERVQVHAPPLLHHAGGQGGVAQGIDQPRSPEREPVDFGEGFGRKDLIGNTAGNLQAMPDVLGRVGLIQRPQSLAKPRPLPQLREGRVVDHIVQ
jgi:type II secretory pathway predicted ATPase ExeA